MIKIQIETDKLGEELKTLPRSRRTSKLK